MDQQRKISMKQMCDTIVAADITPLHMDGTALHAREIYEMSPTGELWHVFEMYDEAIIILGLQYGEHTSP